jgi:hypothetical protein
MIKFILGLPGGGKTYFGVSKMVELLRSDPRPMVANMEEIDIASLNVYLQSLDGADAPNILEKLTIIPKTETFHFYRYRAGGLVLEIPPEKDAAGRKIDRETYLRRMVNYFSPCVENEKHSSGVIYFIDETHEYFNAREWGEMGRSALYYLSKHRHLHDEVYFITQAPEQVEATLKRLCNEFHCVRNHYRESFGMFKKPPEFVRSSYYSLPGPTSKPFETGSFKLDPKGIGSCYKTTGALGSKSGKAEPPVNSKKLPFWALPVAIITCVLLIGVGVSMLPLLAQKGLAVGVKAAMGATERGFKEGLGVNAKPVTSTPENSVSAELAAVPLVATASPSTQQAGEIEGGAYPVGYATARGRTLVYMSDGSARSDEDEGLEKVTRTGCVYKGRQYFFKPAAKKLASQSVSPAPAPGEANSVGYIAPLVPLKSR